MNDPQASDDLSGATREEIMSALFAQMVIQQANMAMMLLGKMPHPQTGQTMHDLEGARMFIDQLEMLEVKTKGNLSKPEENLLKQSLTALHMGFVDAANAAPAAPESAKAPSQPAVENKPPPATGPAPAPEAESAADAESKKKFSKKY